ncbi:hypothetical protein BB560_003266 [Smittium megazygosporum]|uniref:Lon protease homolog, mitochondrial n=1 Tax=Smittium megazygosporum TaxID=133381 RepID=A0A2T9ZCJ2_9FUNG|nr:hypothetical protein BB560_003266 [Smittium megazygosporum]
MLLKVSRKVPKRLVFSQHTFFPLRSPKSSASIIPAPCALFSPYSFNTTLRLFSTSNATFVRNSLCLFKDQADDSSGNNSGPKDNSDKPDDSKASSKSSLDSKAKASKEKSPKKSNQKINSNPPEQDGNLKDTDPSESPKSSEHKAQSEKTEQEESKRFNSKRSSNSEPFESGPSHNKIHVPQEYHKLFVLPIAQRPLFPGFYKAVVIKDPKVIALIKDLLKKGEPFLGAFMLKNETSDVDFIDSADDVHKTGVFTQITSVFPSTIQEEDSLTVVLYSHRRICLNGLSEPVTPSKIVAEPASAAESPETTEPDHAEKDKNVEVEYLSESSEDKFESQDSVQEESIVNNILFEHKLMVGEVSNVPSNNSKNRTPRTKALTSEIVSVFKEISTLNPLFRDQIASFSMSQSAGNVFDNPSRLADFSAAVSSGEPKELQDILEETEIESRLEKALVILKKELLNAQLQNKISKDVEAKIAKRQREFYLMEQLRGIKRELGLESDGKDKLIEKFKAKASALQMPEQVVKVFEEELNKLSHLEPAASEFNVTRNYLDWLTQIPWGKTSMENYDIKKTKKILDEDHYGLEDVKDRILEFVAVGKLKGAIQGKILCFVGPPGVGKTSIGKSIARSLNREFYRFSVGGLSDVAEIKGHRRTYVGAMPGKVVQSLKKTGTQNPLILIDEIDKLGISHQGDPASALLELLDPEQNSSFLDHYMDVPLDLSKVLFVCTANVADTIPGPLLDRMEVIRLSGYLADEKLAIAKNYLIPQTKEMTGLAGSNIDLSENATLALIKHYCRESGVRNLKKHIEKVFRKVALNIIEEGVVKDDEPTESNEPGASGVSSDPEIQDEFTPPELAGSIGFTDFFNENSKAKQASDQASEKAPEQARPMKIPESYKLIIEEEALKKYVGPPIFTSDRLYEETTPGVVMGLAWTSLGGSSLYIESIIVSQRHVDKDNQANKESTSNHSGSFKSTGHLGDVMKESSALAYTYSQAFLNKVDPENDFFKITDIHLHVPEGATPKDGPSAGVTMTTSLLSLATNQRVNPNVAMTGELTLTGRVLKIGGLKEKIIAAKRSGITRVIFPYDNIPDWEDLPEHVKEGVEGCPVKFYEEIPPLVGIKI